MCHPFHEVTWQKYWYCVYICISILYCINLNKKLWYAAMYGKCVKRITNLTLVVHIHGNLVHGSFKVGRISSQRTGWVQNERGKLKAQTSMFEGSTPKPSGVILYMLFSTMLTCLLCLLILESFLVALHWLRMFKSTVSAAKSTHSQGLYPSIPYIMLKQSKK